MPLSISILALAASTLIATVRAVNVVSQQGQNLVVNATGQRFEIVGIDYQPGGSSGYMPGSGIDPLSNATSCLRDAALMQQLGVNTIRSYNLDPDINHDECASIFNQAGIYMILDVNSPLPNESINQANPASSYNLAYLNRTFAVVDAFRNYPNTLGFFSANELVNDDTTAAVDPPYIRAVTRDLKQYMRARGGRTIPVGYSAADVSDILTSNIAYVSCYINDSSDLSRSDFFGLNSYSWCGNATFDSANYGRLTSAFQNSPIPAIFSEYGCNVPSPRYFTEDQAIYGPQMTMFSGGLVYQWTQEGNDFGLIQVNADGSVQLQGDFVRLQTQFNMLNLTILQTVNATAVNLPVPICAPGLISSSAWSSSFDLPAQPAGVAALISTGVKGRTASIVSVTATVVRNVVSNTAGAVITGLAIHSVGGVNVPTGVSGAGSVSATASATGSIMASTTGTAVSTSAAASASATKTGAASRAEVEVLAGAAAAGIAVLMQQF